MELNKLEIFVKKFKITYNNSKYLFKFQLFMQIQKKFRIYLLILRNNRFNQSYKN